jgi:hypothetical protein
MSFARSRWFGPSAVAVSAVAALLAACNGKSSTSPSVPSVDTVSVNQGSAAVIEYYLNGGTPGYDEEPSIEDGNYVETYYNDGSDYGDYRLIAEYPLPALRGRRVVDSATIYWYVCNEYNDNDGGGSGSRVPPKSHPSPFARQPRQSHARGPAGNLTDTVVVDHVLFGAVYQDSATYSGETLASAMSVLVYGTDVTTGWKSASVTSAVQADYAAGRTASQYRLQYSSIASDGEDYIEFAGSSCGSNEAPTGPSFLVVSSH